MGIRTTGKKSATVVTVLLALGSFAGTGAASLALWAHTPAGKTRVATSVGPAAAGPATKQAVASTSDQDDQSPSQAPQQVQPAQPAPAQQAQPAQPAAAPVSQGSGGSAQSQSSGS